MKKIFLFFLIVLVLLLTGCVAQFPPGDDVPVPSGSPTLLPAGPALNPGHVQLAGITNTGVLVVSVSPGVAAAAGANPGGLDRDAVLPAGETQAEEPSGLAALKEQIKEAEGLRLFPYSCSPEKNTITIGYGHNLTAGGISEQIAEQLFDDDFNAAVQDLKTDIFSGVWPQLPEQIRAVLINMRFQLGRDGLLGLGDLVPAVRAMDWLWMAVEMRATRWAGEQTPERAAALIKTVESMIDKRRE